MKKMLHIKADVLRESVQKGTLDAVVGSTEVLDRAGDSIDQSGWKLTAYKKTNPVVLWGHNIKEERPPIGKALKVWVADKGEKAAKLMFKVQFDLQDKFASEIFRKIKDGFINTVSVGFLPVEWELFDEDNLFGGKKYTKQELLELSFVPVPANPEAVVALKGMKDKRFDPIELKDMFPKDKKEKKKKVKKTKKVKVITVTKEDLLKGLTDEQNEVKETKKKKAMIDIVKEKIKEKVKSKKVKVRKEEVKKKKLKSKKVLPYKDLDILPESAPWDGPGEVARAEISDLKLISTWVDSEKPDVKSSYKLPHHKAEGHKAIWRGVAAAMAALLGARGGVEIPDNDRKGVYNHLKKHYKAFDKDTPDFKAVEDQVLAKFDEEIHALILDREDKYAIRLIKKVLKEQKKVKKIKKEQETGSYTTEETEAALKLIDLALSHILKGSEEGGEKTKG